MIKKIGIIGLGTVGSAVVKSLKKYSSVINRRTSLKIEIKYVCDKDKRRKKIASKFNLPFTSDPQVLIDDPQIDIIVELIGGLEPARSIILQAINKGKSVVTANKALLAKYGSEIFSLASQKGRHIGFEASVCGAIPLIKTVSEGLVSCQVNKIYGILNGTTNYILYRMDKGNLDFKSALAEAQDKGFAERKPDLDIDGIDSLHKLCILSYLCFGIWPSPEEVYTDGIANISLLDIVYARHLNYSIKLLAVAKRVGDKLDLRVHPTLIPQEHPLSDVSLAYNAVHLDTAPAGKLIFYGEGAGGIPTSSSVISDIVSIAFDGKQFIRRKEKVSLQGIKNIRMCYYVRFMAQDRPGVLARVSKILESYNISIASVTQKERMRGKFVPIIMLTHEVKEADMEGAITEIDKLSVIKQPSRVIRIERF